MEHAERRVIRVTPADAPRSCYLLVPIQVSASTARLGVGYRLGEDHRVHGPGRTLSALRDTDGRSAWRNRDRHRMCESVCGKAGIHAEKCSDPFIIVDSEQDDGIHVGESLVDVGGEEVARAPIRMCWHAPQVEEVRRG